MCCCCQAFDTESSLSCKRMGDALRSFAVAMTAGGGVVKTQEAGCHALTEFLNDIVSELHAAQHEADTGSHLHPTTRTKARGGSS